MVQWLMTAMAEMARHGCSGEKPDVGRQAEWSDSAPSNFLPLPWSDKLGSRHFLEVKR